MAHCHALMQWPSALGGSAYPPNLCASLWVKVAERGTDRLRGRA